MQHDHHRHRARAGALSRLRLIGSAGTVLALAIGGGVAVERVIAPRSAPAGATRFEVCGSARRMNCVVDGDTFWIAGEKIRIADIDTPETHPARCASEAALGERATLRLQTLLNGGPITMAMGPRDVDRYGRKLRIVSLRGVSVGNTLIDEGLAREWTGRRMPWCV